MMRTYTGGGEERVSASRKLEGSGKTLVHNSMGDDVGRNLTLVKRCIGSAKSATWRQGNTS